MYGLNQGETVKTLDVPEKVSKMHKGTRCTSAQMHESTHTRTHTHSHTLSANTHTHTANASKTNGVGRDARVYL